MQTLAVVGAGPKGIALAAKARALADVGFDAPRVLLLPGMRRQQTQRPDRSGAALPGSAADSS